MKFLAILPVVALSATPALAGPYVNIEANSGFTGSDSVSYTHLTLPTKRIV